MKNTVIILLFLLFLSFANAQTRTFYLSSTGDNNSNGLTVLTAWRSLDMINNIDLEPGDSILLEGGQSFAGSIHLQNEDLGTASNPIVITSYGNGKATIEPNGTEAFYAYNTGGIEIRNLIFQGSGASNNNNNGLSFYIDQTTANISYIFIDHLEIKDFGGAGIMIASGATDKGYRDITIQHSSLHDNGLSGIEIQGTQPDYSHANLNILYCKVYNNYGQAASTLSSSGNGMLISGVDGGLIEYCEAFDNGKLNACEEDGPAGFKLSEARNIVLQYCESHHNKSGLTKNGSGFDLDGGSHNCIVQYSYSHDNDGAGFALMQYGSSNFYLSNIIRYNISQDDGRKNSYGAIYLYGTDSVNQVTKTSVSNNTVYVSAQGLIDGIPSAVKINGNALNGVTIRNNIFYVSSGINMMSVTESLDPTEAIFQNNDYFSTDNASPFLWNGIAYFSLAEWKTSVAGQEMNGIVPTGTGANPNLSNAGNGDIIHPADGGQLASLDGYKLVINSAAIDAGMNLMGMGTHDFYGNAIPYNAIVDIGAFEYSGEMILPLALKTFSGSMDNGSSFLRWEPLTEQTTQSYEIWRSVNGKDFIKKGIVMASGKDAYTFTEQGLSAVIYYYQLHIIQQHNSPILSTIIKVSGNMQHQLSAHYLSSTGFEIEIKTNKDEIAKLLIYDENGRMINQMTQQIFKGINDFSIPSALQWPKGLYFIRFGSEAPVVTKLIK